MWTYKIPIRENYVENAETIITKIANQQAAQIHREKDLVIRSTAIPPIQISGESLEKIIQEIVDNALKFSSGARLLLSK